MKHFLSTLSIVIICSLVLVPSVAATDGCTDGDCPPDPGCTNGDCPPDPGCTNGDCPPDPGCTNGDCPPDPGCTNGDCPYDPPTCTNGDCPEPDPGCTNGTCPPDPGCTNGTCPGYYLLDIDIKPGSYPNCFNNNGNGIIPIAILGADYFHVTRIDTATIMMDILTVKVVGKMDKVLAHIEDVNGDGYDDLVVQIQDIDGVFSSGTGTATVSGLTKEGNDFEGSDSICVVPQ